MRLLWQASLPWLFAGFLLGVHAKVEAEDPNVRKIPLRSHNLSPPYLDSDMQSRYFEFGEDTIVRVDQYIRLTSEIPSQTGWLFSRLPLTATNWMIEIEFKIHGAGSLHGDGFAVWLTKERAQSGPVFGFKDRFEGLGILVDTYKNGRPGTVFPYIMAMLGTETSHPYDKSNDGRDNELAGCSARGLRGASNPTKMRLTYFQEQSLKVELMYKAADEWTDCFETGPLKLPPVYYLGFSGETGELTDNHDIISISSYNLHRLSATNQGQKKDQGGRRKGGRKDRGRDQQSSSGWGWFFLKIIVFAVVLVGGYVGFTLYRTSRRSSRF